MVNEAAERQRKVYKVTLAGGIVNVILVVFKFIAGVLGGSAAMIADALHSLTDLITDVIVVVFVHLSGKPKDKDHDYGHGKFETLATAVVGIALLGAGILIGVQGISKIWQVINGVVLPQPGWIAFIAALVSIALKEFAYQFTARTGKKIHSEAVIANAWHHRSDALSSVGTALGIGGAILLGEGWTVLDPLAALVVSFFIVRAAYTLIRKAMGELLEQSLSDEVENEIIAIAESEDEVSEVHNLKTRRIGNDIAIEMHIRMPGNITLYDAHQHATNIEHHLRDHFGKNTHIGLHLEPVKINGRYERPVS